MKMSGFRASNAMAVLAGLSLLITAFTTQQAYSQNETIDVSCYKGNPEEGNYVGEISVNSPSDAAQNCNLEYDQCGGNCLGCFVDSNFYQVCYDIEGNKVTQGGGTNQAEPGGAMP